MSLAGSWLSFGTTWWHPSPSVQICLGLILGSVICLGFAKTSLQIIPSFICPLQKLWVSQVWAVGTQLLVLCHGIVSCFSVSLHFLSSLSTFSVPLERFKNRDLAEAGQQSPITLYQNLCYCGYYRVLHIRTGKERERQSTSEVNKTTQGNLLKHLTIRNSVNQIMSN